MPKIEIEVLYTRLVREEGSAVITVNVPAAIADDENEIQGWLDEQIEENKIDVMKDIYKHGELSDEDEQIQVDEVHLTE
jgi:hypothetical protein